MSRELGPLGTKWLLATSWPHVPWTPTLRAEALPTARMHLGKALPVQVKASRRPVKTMSVHLTDLCLILESLQQRRDGGHTDTSASPRTPNLWVCSKKRQKRSQTGVWLPGRRSCESLPHENLEGRENQLEQEGRTPGSRS